MSLVERTEQLVTLRELSSRAAAGQGQVALLTGPTATGRSSLLQAAAEQAADAGALVLHAVCAPAERSLEGGVLSQLLHSTPLPPDAYARLATQLATLTTPAVDPADRSAAEVGLRGVHAFCLQLQELAVRQPLVVAVDDVRHADAVSLACLQQLVRRLRGQRILVLVIDNPEPDPAQRAFRAELDRQPQAARFIVAPLSRAGVATALGRPTDDELIDEVHTATGGNPLLLNALTAGGRPDYAAYGQALVSCLHRGDPLARRVAHAVAILDDAAGPVPVPRLLDVEPAAVGQALACLTAAGLLRHGRFPRPEARAAVLGDLPAEHRTALHQRAARLLHEAGAPATAIARHLLDAAAPVPDWALPVLSEAAGHALADGGTDRAVELLDLALCSQPDPWAAAALRVRLCQAEWQLNPVVAARRLPALQADLAAGRLDRHDGIALVRQLLWHGRTEEAGAALEVLRAGDGGAELADLEPWLAHHHPTLSRRRPAAAVAGPAAVVNRRADPWLAATARLAEMALRGQAAEAAGPAQQLLRDLHVGRHTGWADEALLTAVQLLAQADRADSAGDWVNRLLDDAAEQAPTWRAVLTVARAEASLAQGDLTGAATHARGALAVLPAKAWGVAVGLPLSVLVLACARLGRTDEAAAHLAQPTPEAMLAGVPGVRYLYARGGQHLTARHHHAALADFLACGELLRGWGLDAAGVVPWRTGAAEAWLRLGNGEQARNLISAQLSRPGNHSARTRGPTLRLLAATSPVSRRPSLLLESLELLESCGDRYEQARTLADLADAYRALNEDRRARMVFRRALHIAKVVEAGPLHRELLSVGNELGEAQPGADTDRLSLLTGSERRVAALAAIGYTNREIAGKLYITSSTVEQHLTRVYRKLRVKHRRELPIDVARRGGHPSNA